MVRLDQSRQFSLVGVSSIDLYIYVSSYSPVCTPFEGKTINDRNELASTRWGEFCEVT